LYQNQLNLQRLQEQEKELQLRLNQQRELVLQRDQQFFPNTNGLPSFKPVKILKIAMKSSEFT
jgi:hypothetical protein